MVNPFSFIRVWGVIILGWIVAGIPSFLICAANPEWSGWTGMLFGLLTLGAGYAAGFGYMEWMARRTWGKRR